MTKKLQIDFHLVRHGRTQWNVDKRYLGHTDVPLLEDEAAGLESLRGELARTEFTIVLCSDLQRCRATLAKIRPDLKDVTTYDHRLREMNFGNWEGQTYVDLKDIPHYRQWIDTPEFITPPQGEAWNAFKKRVFSVIEEIVDSLLPEDTLPTGKDIHVLILTHGGVIRLLRTLLIPGAHFTDTMINTGSVLRIRTDTSQICSSFH